MCRKLASSWPSASSARSFSPAVSGSASARCCCSDLGSRLTGSVTAMAGTATGTSGSTMPLGTLSGGGGSENEFILGGAKEGFFSAALEPAAAAAEAADAADEGSGGMAILQ